MIWITLLGIAVAILSWSLLQNKPAVDSSTLNRIAKASPSVTDFVKLGPVISSELQTNKVQTIEQSIAKVESPPSAENDPEKVAVLISSLSEAEVCQWLAKLTNQDLTGNTGRLLIRRWVELDPAAAVNWVTQLDDTGVRQELVDVAAIAWSQKDIPNALTWVESLPENDTKHQALADLGYEVARIDPVNAMQIATQLPASDNANGLLLHALAQYASADPQESQQLALTLPPGSLRDQAVTTVATVQAKQDGEAAARFAVENLSPGLDLDRAVMGVVQLWGQNSITDVSAWVQSFPNSPVRDQAVHSLSVMSAP